MAVKSYKKRGIKRHHRKSRKGQRGGGDGGATGYVGGLYGTMEQQMNNSDAHNVIQPLNSHTSMGPAQIGGGKKSRKCESTEKNINEVDFMH